MTGIDSQNLNVCCTAQKLSKIKDFLAFAFAKKQSKSKKAKEQRWLGMSYWSSWSQKRPFFNQNFLQNWVRDAAFGLMAAFVLCARLHLNILNLGKVMLALIFENWDHQQSRQEKKKRVSSKRRWFSNQVTASKRENSALLFHIFFLGPIKKGGDTHFCAFYHKCDNTQHCNATFLKYGPSREKMRK